MPGFRASSTLSYDLWFFFLVMARWPTKREMFCFRCEPRSASVFLCRYLQSMFPVYPRGGPGFCGLDHQGGVNFILFFRGEWGCCGGGKIWARFIGSACNFPGYLFSVWYFLLLLVFWFSGGFLLRGLLPVWRGLLCLVGRIIVGGCMLLSDFV